MVMSTNVGKGSQKCNTSKFSFRYTKEIAASRENARITFESCNE